MLVRLDTGHKNGARPTLRACFWNPPQRQKQNRDATKIVIVARYQTTGPRPVTRGAVYVATLRDFVRQNPRTYIAGETGNWLVVVCDMRAWRYTSRQAAIEDMGERCGQGRCSGVRFHRLLELTQEAPVKVSQWD